jgi:hypothetical protein
MRNSVKINILYSLLTAVFVSGCYTQLMTPQDYMMIRKRQSSAPIADNSYSINYNQSCTSCHSVAELNERAEELESMGILTVHDGVLLSSHQWINENPYADPGPIYWPGPTGPILPPWWEPPVTVVTVPTASPSKGNRPRPDGTTRDDRPDIIRDRPIPAPPTAQPPAPVGGTTPVSIPTPSAPAVIITPAPASTPASQPAEGGRTRDTNSSNESSTTKTRSDGQSRDSSGGSRPR